MLKTKREIYVEFKPCYRTRYKIDKDGDKKYILPFNTTWKTHFTNGGNNSDNFHITKDLKYVYVMYTGIPIFYRITNISSKPILNNGNKINRWKEITKKIEKLKKRKVDYMSKIIKCMRKETAIDSSFNEIINK